MVRTTNQGLTGPHNTHPGWGWQLVGLSGISNLAGWPDREPLSFGMPYTDVIAPRFGVVALMAALIHRKKTGKGKSFSYLKRKGKKKNGELSRYSFSSSVVTASVGRPLAARLATSPSLVEGT
jgi:hypothetical protein